MKRAFIFQDAKSNKFWAIETIDNELCVHYGKIGTIGKYEIKEFDSDAECQKQAEKLIASKTKKGYTEDTGFDYNACIYIDSEDFGPHPLTSHPSYRALVAHEEDFFYSQMDEESPFGSDEGSDTLWNLSDMLRKKPELDFSSYPKYQTERDGSMKYITPDDSLNNWENIEQIESDMSTIATAFAQIKMTGKLNADLKEIALKAIKRMLHEKDGEALTETGKLLYTTLEKFEAC